MSALDDCLRKIDELLDEAARAVSPQLRSRLIQEAMSWQLRADAVSAEPQSAPPRAATRTPRR